MDEYIPDMFTGEATPNPQPVKPEEPERVLSRKEDRKVNGPAFAASLRNEDVKEWVHG